MMNGNVPHGRDEKKRWVRRLGEKKRESMSSARGSGSQGVGDATRGNDGGTWQRARSHAHPADSGLCSVRRLAPPTTSPTATSISMKTLLFSGPAYTIPGNILCLPTSTLSFCIYCVKYFSIIIMLTFKARDLHEGRGQV